MLQTIMESEYGHKRMEIACQQGSAVLIAADHITD